MVQNQYLELLLELGIVGFAIFGAIVIGLFVKTRRAPYFWAILATFVAQWWFFSGYPNALHIFIIMACIYVLSLDKTKA